MFNDSKDSQQESDVYNGWRMTNGDATNTTAKQILTDTSGSWDLTLNLSRFGIYQKNNNQGTF